MGVTLRDIAQRAGVSVATASRTFQRPEMVGAATRAAVEKAAEELGYAPNRSARALITGRSDVYGVIVPDLENPFFPAVLKGAQARAHGHGLQLLLADAGESPQGELPLVQTLAPQVDGIILCSSRMSASDLREAASLLPMALVNRVVDGLPGVFADPVPGLPAAVRHLHRMGHRRIGYVGGPETSRSDTARRGVLESACAELGVGLEDLGHFAPTPEGGRSGAEAVLMTEVTAAIVYNDFMAIALVERLRDFGVSVPTDISVVGWDDIEFASLLSPGLSTVQVPRYDMGATAVDLLRQGVEPGTAVHLPTTFVPRGSTAVAVQPQPDTLSR